MMPKSYLPSQIVNIPKTKQNLHVTARKYFNGFRLFKHSLTFFTSHNEKLLFCGTVNLRNAHFLYPTP